LNRARSQTLPKSALAKACKNMSSSLQLRQGDWIRMPDIGWRQINEFASKKDSIEFFAAYRDEYKSKHPRITIDMVVFALPSQK
jgi:hypothetical protein